MFSHVFLGVTDFDQALRFFDALAAALGLERKFVDRARPWAGWKAAGAERPLLLIGAPFDGQPARPGNGAMAAFLAADRETVRRAHEAALAHGGVCDGPPGLRPEYHPAYYGAYFRDPDGNKLAVACHEPEI